MFNAKKDRMVVEINIEFKNSASFFPSSPSISKVHSCKVPFSSEAPSVPFPLAPLFAFTAFFFLL
jgi:hypothetical protein